MQNNQACLNLFCRDASCIIQIQRKLSAKQSSLLEFVLPRRILYYPNTAKVESRRKIIHSFSFTLNFHYICNIQSDHVDITEKVNTHMEDHKLELSRLFAENNRPEEIMKQLDALHFNVNEVINNTLLRNANN